MGPHRGNSSASSSPSDGAAIVGATLLAGRKCRKREGSKGALDTKDFDPRLRALERRIRGMGLRGLDADALALDLLFPAEVGSRPRRTTTRDLRSRIRGVRRSSERRRLREHGRAHPEGSAGPWCAPSSRVEAAEQRGALIEALRETARGPGEGERALFADRVLARLRGEPVPGGAGTTRLDYRVRAALGAALRRRGIEVTVCGTCPGADRIFLRALEMWKGTRSRKGRAGGAPG